MTNAEMIYLSGVIAAFLVFAIMLTWGDAQSRKARTRR